MHVRYFLCFLLLTTAGLVLFLFSARPALALDCGPSSGCDGYYTVIIPTDPPEEFCAYYNNCPVDTGVNNTCSHDGCPNCPVGEVCTLSYYVCPNKDTGNTSGCEAAPGSGTQTCDYTLSPCKRGSDECGYNSGVEQIAKYPSDQCPDIGCTAIAPQCGESPTPTPSEGGPTPTPTSNPPPLPSSTNTIQGYKVKLPGNQVGTVPPKNETITLGLNGTCGALQQNKDLAYPSLIQPQGWVTKDQCEQFCGERSAPSCLYSTDSNLRLTTGKNCWAGASGLSYIESTPYDTSWATLMSACIRNKGQTTANPYSFQNLLPATSYTVTASVPAGWNVGYTVCDPNTTGCHNNTPTPGSSAIITMPPGDFLGHSGYVDLWWHYTPPSNPPVVAASNLGPGNLCIDSRSVTVSWTYTDPEGDDESAYQVQIDPKGNSFKSPVEYDSGKVPSSVANNTAQSINHSVASYSTTYKARVKLWDKNDNESNWAVSGNYDTPQHAYPAPAFTWTPPAPNTNQTVSFSDGTVFSDGKARDDKSHRWSWTFGDNGSSTVENPTHSYNKSGSYGVTLTATDKDNFTCTGPSQTLNVRGFFPNWREILPKF